MAKKTPTPLAPNANNEFIGACIEIDALMAQLHTLRAAHFNVSPDCHRNWGEVGSARFVAQKLTEALAHYGVGSAA
jgi:hypothetical protein